MTHSNDMVSLARTRTLTALVLFAHFVLVLASPYVVGSLTGRSGVDVAQSSRTVIGLELVVSLAVVVAIAMLALAVAGKPAPRVVLVAVPVAPAFLVIAFASRSVAERPDTVIAALDVFSLGALMLAVTLSAAATAAAFCGIRRWSAATFWAVMIPGSAVVVVFLSLALRSGPFAWVVLLPALVGTVSIAVSASSAGQSLTSGDGVAARESTSTGLLAATMALASIALAAVAAGALELAARVQSGSLPVDVLAARTTIASAWMVALGVVSALVGGFSRRTALVGLAAHAVRSSLLVIGVCALASALVVRGSFGGLVERLASTLRIAARPALDPAVPRLAGTAQSAVGSAPGSSGNAQPVPADAPAAVAAGAGAEPEPEPAVPAGTIQSVSGAGVTIRVLGVGGGGLLLEDAVNGLARRVESFSRCATAEGTVDLRVFVEPSGGVTALKQRGAVPRTSELTTCTMLALYKVGFAPHGGTATVDVHFDYRPN
jgi:hypothetical protein